MLFEVRKPRKNGFYNVKLRFSDTIFWLKYVDGNFTHGTSLRYNTLAECEQRAGANAAMGYWLTDIRGLIWYEVNPEPGLFDVEEN